MKEKARKIDKNEIKEVVLDGGTLVTAHTGVRAVVSVRASFLAGSRFAPGNSSVPEMVAAMLQLGTKKYSKKQIAESLESAGISLSIEAGRDRVNISALLPVARIDLFAKILGSLVSEPTFPEAELKLLRERHIAEVRQGQDDPRTVANRRLGHLAFPPSHPNYSETVEEEMANLERITPATLKKFHTEFYTKGSWHIAVAGDVDEVKWQRVWQGILAKLPVGQTSIVPHPKAHISSTSHDVVSMKEKTSVDVYWAWSCLVDVHSREYFALTVATYILGGDFVSRAMTEVREKRGLTYGAYSFLTGIQAGDSGLLRVWSMFAPDLYGKGLAAMEEVVAKWHKSGITAAELARAKQAMAGGYKVSLATSRGMATALISIMDTGRPLSFLADYPSVLGSLTLPLVNKTIKTYIDPRKMLRVSAGSIDAKGKPLGGPTAK